MNTKPAVESLDAFLFGRAPHPVTCGRGVEIGGGRMIPEINFTLPGIEVTRRNWDEIRRQYEEMVRGVLRHAVELEVPAVVVEFETLPPMTQTPEWGLEITRILAENCAAFSDRHGLATALRVTPNDTREFRRPPLMRRGEHWEQMVRFFDGAGRAGADLLAIESTGGKEVCDDALVNADLRRVVFALGVLGARDMGFLWKQIVRSCRNTDVVPSGDTACGFANTAMTLAWKGMIPKVFAALVRVISVPRSLVAFETGARGPSKDCAYEGPFLKAIAGVPISMEGRSSACAHSSPLGNIAQAVCDCWSNESVANVRLLSGYAPVVSMEQLAYDCRLANAALDDSPEAARSLRDWLASSDASLDPQAYVLRPDIVLEISEEILTGATTYERTIRAARAGWRILDRAHRKAALNLTPREARWLGRMESAVTELPETEAEMREAMAGEIPANAYLPEEYGLT